MHEISIASGILEIATDELAKHALHRLVRVRICYGALSNVVAESLELAFEILTKGGPHDGVQLELVKIPVRLACVHCKHEFFPEGNTAFFEPCPQCGEIGHTLEAGKELYIDHIEAE